MKLRIRKRLPQRFTPAKMARRAKKKLRGKNYAPVPFPTFIQAYFNLVGRRSRKASILSRLFGG